MQELRDLAAVPLEVEALLDAGIMKVSKILELEPGSLIRINRAAGDSIKVSIGGVWAADGDLVAVDNKLCIRIANFRDYP
jgi:flagellar motor switch/type III secretory pathway protein FliN